MTDKERFEKLLEEHQYTFNLLPDSTGGYLYRDTRIAFDFYRLGLGDVQALSELCCNRNIEIGLLNKKLADNQCVVELPPYCCKICGDMREACKKSN